MSDEQTQQEQGDDHDWRQEAWECYVASGADPDGADARHLNPGEAVAAVRELMDSYNEALDELHPSPADLARELYEALKDSLPPLDYNSAAPHIQRYMDAVARYEREVGEE